MIEDTGILYPETNKSNKKLFTIFIVFGKYDTAGEFIASH